MNIHSTYLEDTEILAALETMVQYGVLRETTKNGERAWIENKEFKKKTKKEQERILSQVNFSAELVEKMVGGVAD